MRLVPLLVSLLTLSCGGLPPMRYEVRVRPVNFSPLLLADLNGVPRENLRSIGASLVIVGTDATYDVELAFREAGSECALFGSSVAGALRWQQWTSTPARVEVSTNCTSRGFNQAMTHALLHAVDIARGRASRAMPHIDNAGAVLRTPQYEEWQSGRGVEYVYGGNGLSEQLTSSDVQHFVE
jgi:hypothetical protein